MTAKKLLTKMMTLVLGVIMTFGAICLTAYAEEPELDVKVVTEGEEYVLSLKDYTIPSGSKGLKYYIYPESKISEKSGTYKALDSILPSRCEVEEIIGFFEREEFLGALFAPDSYVGWHIMHHGGYQTASERENLEQFCSDIGLLTEVKKNKRRIRKSRSP